MKLCCSSRSYARMLQAGGLTQLEWIDRCAELAVDGVDFAAAHFPRTDSDYLAHVKKLCVDRGLTTACVTYDTPYGDRDVDRQTADVETWIDRASALGAPLLRFEAGLGTGPSGIAWRELIRGLKVATAAAKERNVTLAVRAREDTLVAAPPDVKRVLKECDSAWLRYAPWLTQLAPVSEPWTSLLGEAVIAVSAGDDEAGLPALRQSRFIGFVTIEANAADPDEDASFATALAHFRSAIARGSITT